MVFSSYLNVADPSFELSQKQLLAVCKPAPFLCMMTAVTTYLKGLPNPTSFFVLRSQISEIHWPTLP